MTNCEECEEALTHIKEYLSVMESEPDEYIKLSEVFQSIKRCLGDE